MQARKEAQGWKQSSALLTQEQAEYISEDVVREDFAVRGNS